MALYTIADLHLSQNAGTNKSMEVFGRRWTGYTQKLQKNWNSLIGEEDTVVVPGDISWALTPEEALQDFLFLDSLNGHKILGKGNHDFWWATAKKLKAFFDKNDIRSIEILHNNAYEVNGTLIAGTRGWFNDGSLNIPPGTDYEKLVNRENMRLEASISCAEALRKNRDLPIYTYMHFPLVWGDFICRPMLETLKRHNIARCYFGHIHGGYGIERVFSFEGIDFQLISADHLDFIPQRVF